MEIKEMCHDELENHLEQVNNLSTDHDFLFPTQILWNKKKLFGYDELNLCKMNNFD